MQLLMDSTPKMNSTVTGPDVPIKLKFNVRVDGKRSRLQLTNPDGLDRRAGSTKANSPRHLGIAGSRTEARRIQTGVAALASDGHMSKGEVDFTVN